MTSKIEKAIEIIGYPVTEKFLKQFDSSFPSHNSVIDVLIESVTKKDDPVGYVDLALAEIDETHIRKNMVEHSTCGNEVLQHHLLQDDGSIVVVMIDLHGIAIVDKHGLVTYHKVSDKGVAAFQFNRLMDKDVRGCDWRVDFSKPSFQGAL